jgi:hypothetical protein
MLSGTGLRAAREGGYVEPLMLGLSASLAGDVATWQQRYEEAHFAGFPEDTVSELDSEGLVLASRAQAELHGKTVGYFSNGRMKLLG